MAVREIILTAQHSTAQHSTAQYSDCAFSSVVHIHKKTDKSINRYVH